MLKNMRYHKNTSRTLEAWQCIHDYIATTLSNNIMYNVFDHSSVQRNSLHIQPHSHSRIKYFYAYLSCGTSHYRLKALYINISSTIHLSVANTSHTQMSNFYHFTSLQKILSFTQILTHTLHTSSNGMSWNNYVTMHGRKYSLGRIKICLLNLYNTYLHIKNSVKIEQ